MPKAPTATKSYHVDLLVNNLKMRVTEPWDNSIILLSKKVSADTRDGFNLDFTMVVSYERGVEGEAILSTDLISVYDVRSSNIKTVLIHKDNQIDPVFISDPVTTVEYFPEGEYYVFCNLKAEFEPSHAQNLSLETIKFYDFKDEKLDDPVLQSREDDLIPVSSRNLIKSSPVFKVNLNSIPWFFQAQNLNHYLFSVAEYVRGNHSSRA